MIFHLLSELKSSKSLDVLAICLNEGVLADKLRSIGLELYVIPEDKYSVLGLLRLSNSMLEGRTINVIHSHRYKEHLLGLFLSMKLGMGRLVATMHGLSELSEKRSRWDRFKTSCIHNAILKHRFERVVAVSHNIKKTLIEEYGFPSEAVEVIHNGIPLPFETTDNRISDRHVLHVGSVGRMVAVKGFVLFLEIAACILRQDVNVVFSILGDGPLKNELNEKAKELRVADRVNFLPPVLDSGPFYNSIDIYLNTSFHEGIPLSILEAMAYMRPIVAPSVGGIPEIVDHEVTGILLGGRDPQQYADACLMLLRAPILREKMGEAGRRTVAARFSSAQMAANYQKLYEG